MNIAPIIRLMRYATLSRGLKLGPEDVMCVEFANSLRAATLDGRFNGIWVHIPNQLASGHKTGVKSAIARAMGMHKGASDYVFLGSDKSLALEAKSLVGRQTDNQKDFQVWCAKMNINYRIFRTVKEGEKILRDEGFLE